MKDWIVDHLRARTYGLRKKERRRVWIAGRPAKQPPEGSGYIEGPQGSADGDGGGMA